MFTGLSTLRKQGDDGKPKDLSEKAKQLQAYLASKYVDTNNTKEHAKKKKKKKSTTIGGAAVQIVDKDVSGFIDVSAGPARNADAEEDEDEGPLIANPEEAERALRLKQKEAELLQQWKTVDVQPGVKKRQRYDSDDDPSPPRKARRDSSDVSPSRRRQKHDSEDPSPPRKPRHDSPDVSPPRRRQRHDSEDASPPRKPRHDSPDVSPPRRRQRHDSEDASPPRKLRHDSPDVSPPRRPQRHDSCDPSPPRRQRNDRTGPEAPRMSQQDSKDVSLPRRRPGHDSRDVSPPRRPGRQDDQDISPSHKASKLQQNEMAPKHTSKPHYAAGASTMKDGRPQMTDGRLGGIVTNSELIAEVRQKKEQERARFAQLRDEETGRGAQTVYRNREGKVVDVSEAAEHAGKKRKKPPREFEGEKELAWGGGLAQRRAREEQLRRMREDEARPFAKGRDDKELNDELKERQRWGDPMAQVTTNKGAGAPSAPGALLKGKKAKKAGFVVPQQVPPHSWMRRNVPAAPNRYGIKPGRHWDGVDRSNGFENELFKTQNQRRAREQEDYAYSVMDM